MKRATKLGVVWIGLYVAAVFLPLGVVLSGATPPARSIIVEFAVAMGFVGLAMMGFQFALTARFRAIAGTLGMDNMLQFHRQAGFIAALFVLGHAVAIVLVDSQYLAFLDPRVNPQRAAALSLAVLLLLALLSLTMWRKQIGLPYEWWRLSHGVIGSLVLLIGLAHVIMVDYLASEPWKKAVIIALVVGSLLLLVQARVVKPLLALRRPWRVASVRKEIDRVWTLTLEADGHDGMRFRPGQCVWMTIDRSPFALAQHPFTIASSAAILQGGDRHGSIQLTIKELGDYTANIGAVEIGSRAFLEGPYGAATLDVHSDAPAVFIVGGIGITPAMSMLRTLRDRESTPPLLLMYACASEDRIIFRYELERMRDEIGLQIVYVLESPTAENCECERGFVTPDVLAKYLTGPFAQPQAQFFVCGPEPMMNAVEPALVERGVSIHNIHSERFQIV